MMHRSLVRASARLCLLAGACLLLHPVPARGYSSGPPDGYAGDPPRFHACTSCHSSFPLNSGNGALDLQGLPASYVPGQTYPLTVYLTDPGQRRWGFEMTVIRQSDGLQAGAMAPVDGTAQVSEGPGDQRDYAKQTAQGTFPNGSFGSWQILWTAPPDGSGPVRFYVAGNAANNNNATTFDYIYAIAGSVSQSIPMGVDESSVNQEEIRLTVCPNPVRDRALILWSAPTVQPVHLRVVDLLGRTVCVFPATDRRNGQISWDGCDADGRRLPGGLYGCLLTTGDRTRSFKIVVLP